MEPTLAPLFTPLQVGTLELSNRFVMPSMQRGFAPAGVPTAQMASYYRRRLEHGVALAIGEGTAVNHPSATDYDDFALLTPEAQAGWKRLLDEVKAVDGRIFLQLWHQGGIRQEGKGPHPRADTLSPSGFALPDQPNGRAMTRRDIADLVESFADGAALAQSLGFDGVEVHCAHGYLLDQFVWSGTNLRDDEYGGSLQNRLRFPTEVIAAVRRAVGPDYPVSVRISQWKTRAWDARNFATPLELEMAVQALVDAGANLLHASTRRFWEAEFVGSGLSFAGWVKRLSGVPVIAVGSVGVDVDIMASLSGQECGAADSIWKQALIECFANDEFDLVAVGRAVLADAEWVEKIRQGKSDRIQPFTKEALAFLS